MTPRSSQSMRRRVQRRWMAQRQRMQALSQKDSKTISPRRSGKKETSRHTVRRLFR